MLHERSHLPPSPSDSQPLQIPRTKWDEPRGMHILVPTGLNDRERHTLTLALQIAAGLSARITLLHVMPISEEAELLQSRNPWHWLDAIDNLHTRLSSKPRESDLREQEVSRARMRLFLEKAAVPQALELANVQLECVRGEVVAEVLRVAADKSVNFVLLSSSFSWWGLPVVPTRLHQLLQQMNKTVLVVRPDPAADRAAVPQVAQAENAFA